MHWPESVADVIDVSGWWEVDYEEQLGTRDKLWVSPDRDADVPLALLKQGRIGGLPEPGADLWAEVLASRIARMVAVPCAQTAFATHNEMGRCVLSKLIDGHLAFGNQLLPRVVQGYPALRTDPEHYTVENIALALGGYQGSEPGLSAFESFVGYLAFDALIANTDRHHENWAIIEESQALAPSYDHGASLGFNAHHDRVHDMHRFARKGRSSPFASNLSELAQFGLGLVSDRVRGLWTDRMSRVTSESLRELVDEIPAGWMSDAARTFVVDLVLANQGRLLS